MDKSNRLFERAQTKWNLTHNQQQRRSRIHSAGKENKSPDLKTTTVKRHTINPLDNTNQFLNDCRSESQHFTECPSKTKLDPPRSKLTCRRRFGSHPFSRTNFVFDNDFLNSTTNDRTLLPDSTVDLSDQFASISFIDDDTSSAKQAVLDACHPAEPIPFELAYPEDLPQCRKIGEGISGEVFMYRPSRKESIVLKVIPIEGKFPVNGEAQKTWDEILPEIVISTQLSNLRNGRDFAASGFANLLRVRCVQGVYPEHLVDQWLLYDDNYGTYNDDPSQFGPDQLYIVFEQEYAGLDLEAFKFHNAQQALSALRQITLSLAVAEVQLGFEHRDLHWGNILLVPTTEQTIQFMLNGKSISVESHFVKATIIDYTLSRINHNHRIYRNDLTNETELFDANGDYQFVIYRQMKELVNNDWEAFNPATNVLWLHYVVDKFIDGAHYQSTRTRNHLNVITKLMTIRDDILANVSVLAAVPTICY